MKTRKTKQKGFLRLPTQLPYLNMATHYALKLFAANFTLRPSLRKYLKTQDGWIQMSIGMSTESGDMAQRLIFKNGKISVMAGTEDVDALLIYKNKKIVHAMLTMTPNEVLLALLEGQLRIEGNMSVMSLFNFYLSLLMSAPNKKRMMRKKQYARQNTCSIAETLTIQSAPDKSITDKLRIERIASQPCDQVRFLSDPFLSQFSLADFSVIEQSLQRHFELTPEICIERPCLLTDWFRKNGFETHPDNTAWNPVLRQANAFNYLMTNKQARIGNHALLGGTTTTKEVGVVLYPDAHATLLWGELLLLPDRTLNPYHIAKDDIERLHKDILPFWMHRNFREWVRKQYGAPLCQQLDERFAVYFSWKTVALSHTVVDFPKLLKIGIAGLIAEIRSTPTQDASQQNTHQAMIICLEGISIYCQNIAITARRQADEEQNPQRKQEIIHIVQMCQIIATHAPSTLDEALQLIWVGWIALHMENTNAGLSFGRMDQWLQPFFLSDMAKLSTSEEQQAYIKHCIEMVGCFYMCCTDHLPTIPDIGNYLFGGSSSTQAITLGGITPDGKSAVNDMTFIFLKVTEMLKLRDPNINARYHEQKNSRSYLERLCEVNLITCATPSIHCDTGVIKSLQDKGYDPEDINDWSVIGCVEPALSGKHMGHTGSTMFNMVAALEMALNRGKHPLMDWTVGPDTGKPERFQSFDAFFDAFSQQLQFLVDNAVSYNNQLGEAHAQLRPTPLLSSMMTGCIEKGRDATQGGAKYNSSGVACIGLSDVADSLMSIKKLVFEDGAITFAELLSALNTNFKYHPKIHALIMHAVPKFGSGHAESRAMANRVTELVHRQFSSKKNYRGGSYTTGFWSMSNHVAFGNLTGALPSGRKARKAFTPGLTPSAQASKNLLDNINDVAGLHPENMDNNVAFNIKYVPSAEDSHQQSVKNMSAYVKAYSQQGGMQMQLNVVSSEQLKDAMIHPENYRDLLVRISGYNAYFVTLNTEMQIELVERAQFNA